MLQILLIFLLVTFSGGIGFYLGRSSVAPTHVAANDQNKGSQSRSRVEDSVKPIPANPDAPAATPVYPAPGEPAPNDPALESRAIGLPIAGLQDSDLLDTYLDARGGGQRTHEAVDIHAPRGTPVIAVEAGKVAKLFTSDAGGLTVYQFDPTQAYAYYYAHLHRYAEGLKEGMVLKQGDRIGFAGTTGNADPNTPHLHFAIFKLGPEKRWWEGQPINPYPVLKRAVAK